VPVTDVRIVDPSTRKDVPEGKVGLLLVRGPQVMKRYYGNDGEWLLTLDMRVSCRTRLCLQKPQRPRSTRTDGWIRATLHKWMKRDLSTSEIGVSFVTSPFVQALQLTGTEKDIIIRGGENVSASAESARAFPRPS
jgi:acyl-CoA synthetase (AMP-forming)/AMP-acid ligase II